MESPASEGPPSSESFPIKVKYGFNIVTPGGKYSPSQWFWMPILPHLGLPPISLFFGAGFGRFLNHYIGFKVNRNIEDEKQNHWKLSALKLNSVIIEKKERGVGKEITNSPQKQVLELLYSV